MEPCPKLHSVMLLIAEDGENSMGEQLMQSPTAASTSGQGSLYEESNSDSVLADAQNLAVDHEVANSENKHQELNYSDHATEDHCDEHIKSSSSEETHAMPTSENNLTLHGGGVSHDMNM
ncbi:hypothetical protein D1007_12362 [Hordeum vulgare]|nr:hypothetical protein D1007_12362 [Hordeum vulgare]